MKRRTIRLLTLIMILAMSVAAFFATTVFTASAETYEAKDIFSRSAGVSDNTDKDYVAYTMGAESNITYNKTLALKWVKEGAQYFSTTVAFDGVNFSKFSLKLESAQLTMNKDEKSENTLTFVAEGSTLQAYVNGKDEKKVAVTPSENGDFVIALTEQKVTDGDLVALDGTSGEFNVTVNGKGVGVFTNIGSNYAEYKSASMTPLQYSVEELQSGKEAQVVEIRSLNNQSLKLNEQKKVNDDAAPVFVMNNEIKVLPLGTKLSFDYKVIDVLRSAVATSSSSYTTFYAYVLTTEGDAERVQPEPKEGETSYKRYTSLSDLVFMDKEDDKDIRLADGNAYVSVAFRVTDNTNSDIYYLEDYATSVKYEDSTYNYVKVSTNVESNPVYDGTGEAIVDYRVAVNNAALTEEGKSIQIGSGAYFYVPSLRSLIFDESCGYTELTFDIYYKNQSTENGSATGRAYNELRFEVSTAGVYEFKVVAKNKFGKVMQYVDKEGNAFDVTSSNVWDAEEIPSFSFRVHNEGPSIEESEVNDMGYIDVTYTFSSFKIIGLTGYGSEYKLYRMANYSSDISIEEVNQNPDDEKYEWVEIEAYDSEKDEDEGDNPYEWRPTSRSFIPQTASIYKITLKVVDNDKLSAASHQVVRVESKRTVNQGETYWLRDNILSVVFMSVGGLCLVGIVVLLVIKPKESETAASDKKSRKDRLKEKRENRK